MTDTAAAPATPPKKKKKKPTALARPAPLVELNFNTNHGYDLVMRRAIAYASSSAVPAMFQGGPSSQGLANCVVALELSHRLDFPFLLVAQNLTLVDGRPSWQGKFHVALVQGGGRFKDHGWEVNDEPKPGEEPRDTFGKRFYATRVSDGKVCVGEWITVGMAKLKGWWSKVDRNGVERSHWPSMTGQMLSYRSASFWAATWDPGATMGLRSVEEELDALHANGGDVTQAQAAPPMPPARNALVQLAPAAAPSPRDEPEDATLEPGFDPPSMDDVPTEDPLADVKEALEARNVRAALEAIGKRARGSQERRDAEQLYNTAMRRGS